ncbi:MAG: DUF523 and DUF1722 domain-containing protein [Proteobacteria bacterium]|nr:DUF523 and DUF1722 domain-containing protein [Pseudomonadota bacterium]
MPHPIRVGISSCLLGDEVRYNGGHKLDLYLRDILGQFVEFVPVCPEAEVGMGIPREPVRLVGDVANPRLVGRESGKDWTQQMLRWTDGRLKKLESFHLCGFVFKKGSPSSGMEKVRVYPDGGGQPLYSGRGFFAGRFMDHFPQLPVEDDGRLNDPGLRENFIERIFVMYRWLESTNDGPNMKALIEFHTRHKLLIMSHSVEAYRELGRLVAGHGKAVGISRLFEQYSTILFTNLQLKATPKKHRNVLQHCLGYFKKQITQDEKQEMLHLIDQFVEKNIPLIVPMTLMNHFVRKYAEPYLASQHYLSPHTLELKLRNHV